MDTDLQRAKRTGDPVAELVALNRMPALRSLPPCRHCGRDLSRVDVRCESCQWHGPRRRQRDSGEPWSPWPACTACNGTGRTEWSWHGDGGRLALMAYCGDEAARALVADDPDWWASSNARVVQDGDLSDWLRGLDRWLGAGILAGQAVLRTLEGEPTPGGGVVTAEARLALDAATEHHHCGCEASREAWSAACELLPGPVHWVPCPQDDWTKGAIAMAIEATDEPTIRAAICAGLTGWARTGVL